MMKRQGREQEYVQAIEFKAGKQQALSFFFDLYYQPLCYFALRLTQEEQQSQDIVGDCFIKLWQKHSEFDTPQNIKAFLYISCRNSCFNFLRDTKRKHAGQQEYLGQLEQSENKILNEIMLAEYMQILHDEVALLPKQCQEVFKLVYFDGKKTSEIALELELSPKTVRNYKANALEKLKTAFLKKGISEALLLAFLIYIENKYFQ